MIRLITTVDDVPHERSAPSAPGTGVATSARAGLSTRDPRRADGAARNVAEFTGMRASDSKQAAGYADGATAMARPAAVAVTGVAAAEAPQGTDTTGRIAHVFGLQDARNAQPVSHLMLHLDATDGGEDRVRVALRGTRVGATMEVRDGSSAAQLSHGLPELSRSLEALGLETGLLRVQSPVAGDTTALAGFVRAVAGDAAVQRGTLFADTGSQFSRSRDDAPGQHTQQESPRHRFRREQKEHKP